MARQGGNSGNGCFSSYARLSGGRLTNFYFGRPVARVNLSIILVTLSTPVTARMGILDGKVVDGLMLSLRTLTCRTRREEWGVQSNLEEWGDEEEENGLGPDQGEKNLEA